MNCEKYREQIIAHLGGEECSKELKQHLRECSQCREYLEESREVVELLTPTQLPKTPTDIVENVVNKLKDAEMKKRKKRRRTMQFTSGVAAIFMIGLVVSVIAYFPTEARAAKKMIDKSLASTEKVKSMEMKLNYRTLQHEGFSAIGLEYDMVPHKITSQLGDNEIWRIEKDERILMYNGDNLYGWYPKRKHGYFDDKSQRYGHADWLATLLDPQKILILEKLYGESKSGKHSFRKDKENSYVTVYAPAQGDFSQSDYGRNTSIEEADTRREYVFDAKTNLLKSVKIYVEDGEQDVLVLETTSIKYDLPIDVAALTAIPEGFEWTDQNKLRGEVKEGSPFANITPLEAAKLILKQMQEYDIDASDAYGYFTKYQRASLLQVYGGLKSVKFLEPFRSGDYAGWFVPCEMVLRDGKVKQTNLAVRNDNASKIWMLDGGL